MLRFVFNLPSPAAILEGAIDPLMALALHEIDVVGMHRLSPEAARKAELRRKEVEEKEFKDTLSERQEAAQRKREDGLSAKEKLAAMEKRKKKELKKQSKRMVMKRG